MIIRNTVAVWGWLICSGFLFGCAVMSWLILNEPIPGETSAVLMGIFNLILWAVGLFAAHKMFTKPVTVLRCHTDGISIDSYWLWKRVRNCYAKDCIRAMTIDESEDTEGNPYFTASIIFDNGIKISFAEAHLRAFCEQATCKLKQALNLEPVPRI